MKRATSTLTTVYAWFQRSDVRRWPRRKQRVYFRTNRSDPDLSGFMPDLIVGYESPTQIIIRPQRCDLRGWF